jgi:phage FluMu gp28-like protein
MVLLCEQGRSQNIISHRENASKLVIDDCQYWIDHLISMGLTKSKYWEQLRGTIRYLPNNSTIVALPCIPRVIRGRKGDVFIDEAAHIPDPLLRQILAAAKPLSTWGGKITLISSPFGSGIYSDLCKDPSWKLHTTDIHTATDEGLYRVICEQSGQPKPSREDELKWVEDLIKSAGVFAPQEYLCQDLGDSSSNWLSPNSVLNHIPIIYPNSPVAYQLAISGPHSIGVDVGVSESPTVISFAVESGIAQIIEVRNWNIPQINQLVKSLINSYTTTIAIDSNGIGRGLADSLADEYENVVHAPNTSQWFSSHVTQFLSAVWSGSFSISNDPTILSDLNGVSMGNGKITLAHYKSNGESRHCDSIPSMALAYQYRPDDDQLLPSVWG